ncbi:hypothetical protein D8Y22_05050 [Salinadaptatus halalkaliphilus]|uniref:Halobacterial output domain-containing protein n=1 Tax=Salinadaptatus halalkaliphilus TaxID=2419781 RepID=A0A4S3TNJ3_9EURY|nr:HalOD1 output domain-containing protein [Salinadaptatus halalkaliphilus]THE65894.1 hypothetical protein D8Y22_05050 [Salinadaptatus halalkaliphilus]
MDAVTVDADTTVSSSKPSVTIVERIAKRDGVDPTELTPPLYSAIDPEALDSLFSTTDGTDARSVGNVRFTYNGYEVCVQSSGEISISER